MKLSKILVVILLCALPIICAHGAPTSDQSFKCYASRTPNTYGSKSEKLFSGPQNFQEAYSEVNQIFEVDNLFGWISRNPQPGTMCMGIYYHKDKNITVYSQSCGPISITSPIQLQVLVGDTKYYMGCDPE